MKTPVWFSRISVFSHLRITATVLLFFASAAMAFFAAFGPTAGVAEAQISPKPMPFPPIPPEKGARAFAATNFAGTRAQERRPLGRRATPSLERGQLLRRRPYRALRRR